MVPKSWDLISFGSIYKEICVWSRQQGCCLYRGDLKELAFLFISSFLTFGSRPLKCAELCVREGMRNHEVSSWINFKSTAWCVSLWLATWRFWESLPPTLLKSLFLYWASVLMCNSLPLCPRFAPGSGLGSFIELAYLFLLHVPEASSHSYFPSWPVPTP